MQNIQDIYNKYAKVVYKYVFCLTGDKDIAEEIVQETFLVAVKDIKKFKGECKITTWLCQISKYIWYKRLKKEKTNKEISLQILNDSLLSDNKLVDDILDKERREELFKKIHNLDTETREVIYLRILGNLEYNEISQIMNKTTNWARITFFRGKEKLKEEFNDEE